jgi:hypothetical protein
VHDRARSSVSLRQGSYRGGYTAVRSSLAAGGWIPTVSSSSAGQLGTYERASTNSAAASFIAAASRRPAERLHAPDWVPARGWIATRATEVGRLLLAGRYEGRQPAAVGLLPYGRPAGGPAMAWFALRGWVPMGSGRAAVVLRVVGSPQRR